MFRIVCPACRKSFVWTDDMPLQGPCPQPDCGGTYDVHGALKENLARRATAAGPGLSCPRCGAAIETPWGLCPGCGSLVAGSRALTRKHLLLAALIVLLCLSLLWKHLW